MKIVMEVTEGEYTAALHALEVYRTKVQGAAHLVKTTASRQRQVKMLTNLTMFERKLEHGHVA